MQSLLSLVVLLIFAAIWFLPIYKKQQAVSGVVTKKDLTKAFLYGLFPVTIVILLCEVVFGWILKFAGITEGMLSYAILESFIMFGLIEELVKYFFVKLLLKKKTSLCRSDIMVVFATVGLGYEVIEGFFFGNPIGSIIRGIFVAHMMYQLVMAHFYCESLKAKEAGDEKKAKRLAVYSIIVPFIVHGFNDLFCELTNFEGLNIDESIRTIGCTLIIVLMQLFMAIIGFKLARKNPEQNLILSEEKPEAQE